jgi:Na+-driven multidrug efflux pump
MKEQQLPCVTMTKSVENTALSNGKVSAAVSFLRTFGFIMAFLLVLPRFLEVTGGWLAVPLAEFLTLILTVYLIFKNQKLYHYF